MQRVFIRLVAFGAACWLSATHGLKFGARVPNLGNPFGSSDSGSDPTGNAYDRFVGGALDWRREGDC
jgi:hypothetical protein